MVLVAYSDNNRGDAPVLDMERVLATADSATPDGWLTTFNNTRKHEVVILKNDPGAAWRSLASVRGYVYPLTKGSVSFVTVSGTRCPLHEMKVVQSAGNKEVVDITFAVDYTCVQASDSARWKMDMQFPVGFTPMCCVSKESEFQFLAIAFRDAGIVAVDVTPVSFTLIWDIPGPCKVELLSGDEPKRTIPDQKHKLEVLNVVAASTYSVTVTSEVTGEFCVVDVAVPVRSRQLMESFFRSRRLPDRAYDLTSVSQENIRYLRQNHVMKSGDKILVKPADKEGGVAACIAACGDTVELTSGNNIYVVPDFEDNNSQYICLQQRLRSFMLEFDRSESFVKFNGNVYPHGSRFTLDKQRLEVAKGSIILLVTDADAIDAVTFPGGTSDATTVQNAGDVIVRDVVMRDLYQVGEKVAGDTTYLASSFFVYDPSDDTTTECSRLSAGLSDAKDTGSVSVDVLYSSSLKRTFETNRSETNISSTDGTDGITATFNSAGLYFDSDKGDIYFGAGKDFRIHFSGVDGLDPAMLQIQSLDGADYVTRFLVTSEL